MHYMNLDRSPLHFNIWVSFSHTWWSNTSNNCKWTSARTLNWKPIYYYYFFFFFVNEWLNSISFNPAGIVDSWLCLDKTTTKLKMLELQDTIPILLDISWKGLKIAPSCLHERIKFPFIMHVQLCVAEQDHGGNHIHKTCLEWQSTSGWRSTVLSAMLIN